MKNFGVVSYNIHANFTNYGSALQSWALTQIINKLGQGRWQAKLVDYCPDILADKDILNPIKNMWDKDEESIRLCKMSLPAIRENYKKFNEFYNKEFLKTKKTYTSRNFNDIIKEEEINGFVCGSDTIFCIDEFGIDDGYYANYECMKNGYSFSYATSFGDSHFDAETYKTLNERIKNFKSLGIRESAMIPYLKEHTNVEVQRVLDPTLLLEQSDYDKITFPIKLDDEKYILLYARRKNDKMTAFVDELAHKEGLKVIEISLQATNAYKHRMFYEAGVEEFLSLVKNAEYVVTNSYHGMIFSIQFRKKFIVFSREQCDTKIMELMDTVGLKDRMFVDGKENVMQEINYEEVFNKIQREKIKSIKFLEDNLNKCR